jgi:hypothetical protein
MPLLCLSAMDWPILVGRKSSTIFIIFLFLLFLFREKPDLMRKGDEIFQFDGNVTYK